MKILTLIFALVLIAGDAYAIGYGGFRGGSYGFRPSVPSFRPSYRPTPATVRPLAPAKAPKAEASKPAAKTIPARSASPSAAVSQPTPWHWFFIHGFLAGNASADAKADDCKDKECKK